MKFSRRVFAALIIVVTAILILIFAYYESRQNIAFDPENSEEIYVGKETMVIWYADPDLAEYIQSAAVAFTGKRQNQHLRIIPVLVSALEYLENINRTSVNNEGPDLYVIGHDNLEKAYLAGLAAIVLPEYFNPVRQQYPGTGINAVSYKNRILAYPLYFETSALLYNRSLLEEMVRIKIERDADEAAAEEAMLNLETYGPEDDISEIPAYLEDVERLKNDMVFIENQVAMLMPETFEDLKNFANDYDAPAGVEGLLKWDVNDIFYNYFFVGDTILAGGESGDDINNIDIYNPLAIRSMRMYQELNQFFAIDSNQVKYRDVIDEFIDGKLIFTVATTDIVAKLDEAINTGDFIYEYGILRTPDIDENTLTRPLSMVGSVVINGYSEKQNDANRFAVFLTGEFAENLYARTGKVPAAFNAVPDNEHLNVFTLEFARSIPLPKMIETSNFWIQLEITFARIWEGADANRELKGLSEQIMSQVTGAPYLEELIEEIFEEIEEVEYLDEDEMTIEALLE